MDGQVDGSRDGAVLTISFNRPAKKNALNMAMYEQAVAHFEAAAKDSAIRAVVLTGSNGVFTAGNDLSEFLTRPPLAESSPALALFRKVIDFEKPVIAAVAGPAWGIGTTLLPHCDLVIAATSAKFAMPFVNLGVVPEGASSILIPKLAGMARASHLLLLAEPFDAQTALDCGIVSEVVPDAEFAARAKLRADALAKKPPEALRAAKKLLRDPMRKEIHEAIAREANVFLERLGSEEAMTAIGAMLSARK